MQMKRPISALRDFIVKREIQTLKMNSWQYHQYMVYLACVLETGDFSMLWELDLAEIAACISQAVLHSMKIDLNHRHHEEFRLPKEQEKMLY